MTIRDHFNLAGKLVRIMDAQFELFGIRFGLDPILGLFPVGNWVTALTSFYLFWLAYRLEVPTWVYGRMVLHIFLDFLMTSVPILGNIADIFYKSNELNLSLLSRFHNKNDVIEGQYAEDDN